MKNSKRKNHRPAISSFIALVCAMTIIGSASARAFHTADLEVTSSSNISNETDSTSQLFQKGIVFSIPAGKSFEKQSLIVPIGKRLVIEYGSALISLPGGQSLINIAVTTIVDGATANYFLLPFAQGFNGLSENFTASQQLKLYADPGTAVVFTVSRNSFAGSAAVNITVSGYLEDVP